MSMSMSMSVTMTIPRMTETKNDGAFLLGLVHDPEPHSGAESLGGDSVARSWHMRVESHDDGAFKRRSKTR
ncbi:MAG: hypothetical protein J3Q66DRAFT_323617 [Benniella sp.]|nr:MAG: hypothetical protein J3Q66DRAFT_323617 [Benniella sp.]